MNVLHEFVRQAARTPHAAAVIQLQKRGDGTFDEHVMYTYQSLTEAARQLASGLRKLAGAHSHIGLVAGNSAEWVLADLALMFGELTEVPVPLAFSAQQAAWLLHNCKIVLADAAGAARIEQWRETGQQAGPYPPLRTLNLSLRDPVGTSACEPLSLPQAGRDSIVKIVHTSGTTSQPKGVLIRRHGLDALVGSLWRCAAKDDYQRYLNLVPLSLLIEQVTAIYMPLTSGGALLLPPADMPPLGSPGVVAADRLELIRAARASALTLTPALVEAMAARTRELEAGADPMQKLFGRPNAPLLAAGGAPVSKAALIALEGCGIPVYQGYGLSENSSVATWNRRGANRIGTAGQPLPHVQVRIADDGELCLRSSSLFAGYSNDDPSSCVVDDGGWLHTGDLARLDSDGFVTITGRKKTLIITANGRNISPEWLESAYRSVPGVLHVIVHGDRQQFLGGIFVVADLSHEQQTRQAIAAYARAHLSEIEQIPAPVLVEHTAQVMEQLFTVTGRPRRDAVATFLSSHHKAQPLDEHS
jgi:long-subunit acyl-CoA synthetase (AMP-forming)